MKRTILIVLLGLGTVGGFACGITSAVHHHRAHRAAFERHVADICTESAQRSHAVQLRDEPRPTE